MLLLSLLVAGAACSLFPPASYRLNDTKKPSYAYPRVVGFFVENGVDKFGIELHGLYYTYDCTGENRNIYRSGKTVVQFICTTDYSSLFNAIFFNLNANFTTIKKSFNVGGMLIDNNESLILSVNDEFRRFSIETDNGSSRKSFPRALYRLVDPVHNRSGLPREIGFYRENGVDSLAVELHQFYYIYTCDGERHFHYENKKLTNTYVCLSFELFWTPTFILTAEIRNKRTELYSNGVISGRKVTFHINGKLATYATNSTGVTDRPAIATTTRSPARRTVFPSFNYYAVPIVKGLPFPDEIYSSTTLNGIGRLIFVKNNVERSFECDGILRPLEPAQQGSPQEEYECFVNTQKNGKITKFYLYVGPKNDDGEEHPFQYYVGKFCRRFSVLSLRAFGHTLPIHYRGIDMYVPKS